MFGTSGVRGPVGETVTGPVAIGLGRALGSMAGRIVVGRDARPSGDALARAAIAGAQETGTTVVDVGVQSTPTVARAVEWYDAEAGLVVTGSHNPPEDNGFKFWTRRGHAFGPHLNRMLVQQAATSDPPTVDPGEMGTVSAAEDADQRHLERLPEADLGDLSVVVDVGHGTGRLTADALRQMGCSVATVDPSHGDAAAGRPTPDSCAVLSEVVVDTGADLGIAHDADADRTLAVDETGAFVSGDDLLALFAIEMVPEDARVAATINASSVVHAVVEQLGGSVVRTAVGDGPVGAACLEDDVVFGGDPSGAWVWPDEALSPDGHYAACRLAAIVADGSPLSDRVAALPDLVTHREAVPCDDGEAASSRVESLVRDRYDAVTDVDGVRADVDGGWFLVRESGTEPVLRVTVEARTAERAADLRGDVRTIVRDALRATRGESTLDDEPRNGRVPSAEDA